MEDEAADVAGITVRIFPQPSPKAEINVANARSCFRPFILAENAIDASYA